MKKINWKNVFSSLLFKIAVAIALGWIVGTFSPEWFNRISASVTGLFGNFLGFAIPLIILGLVAPGIAELGEGGGRLLLITVGIAYGSTVFSGLFTYGACTITYPWLLSGQGALTSLEPADAAKAYFTLEMPPVFSVMTALILAFVLGIALAAMKERVLKDALVEFREVVNKLIAKAIIPFLPIYIFCMFLNLSAGGQIGGVMAVFVKIFFFILLLSLVLLLIYYTVAWAFGGGNPFRNLGIMMKAYGTALGTQSSAATIPITFEQSIKTGVDKNIAGFVIPLCATIHLSGSMMKITACAIALMLITGMPFNFGMMIGFILMLGVAMVAAPGVPGGAIMAALGILGSMLGFDETMLGLMIALYIAMDSFGTACNVTGDGAIALVMNKIAGKDKKE